MRSVSTSVIVSVSTSSSAVHIKEETALKPGMVITVHPQLVSRGKEATVWFADTYLITEDIAEALQDRPGYNMRRE